jgi:hypothetical protein
MENFASLYLFLLCRLIWPISIQLNLSFGDILWKERKERQLNIAALTARTDYTNTFIKQGSFMFLTLVYLPWILGVVIKTLYSTSNNNCFSKIDFRRFLIFCFMDEMCQCNIPYTHHWHAGLHLTTLLHQASLCTL